MNDRHPLPTTRQLLCLQLHKKVLLLQPFLAEKVTGVLIYNRNNSEIIDVLSSDELLQHRVNLVIASLEENKADLLGEKLFLSVVQHESELCAQVTGMLLELPLTRLLSLLADDDELKLKVKCARENYLSYIKRKNESTKGEVVEPDASVL
ncbi:Polyadenylate-binding protein/Hyperplastic disc protein [Trinorchestia longiramus]|nr:Polyadenylate-binding protein/Hyperplastic disc protein [Trinorchestia longiramus]